jgi:hypothetical protein
MKKLVDIFKITQDVKLGDVYEKKEYLTGT